MTLALHVCLFVKRNLGKQKPVTCVSSINNGNLIVCGSRDLRVTFWNGAKLTKNEGEQPRPTHVFHAHHDEIVSLATNAILGLAVSSDQGNYVCIHDTLNPKILTTFSLSFGNKGPQSVISKLFLSPAGFLIAGSSTKSLLCNFSGETLRSFDAKYVNFADSLSLKLVK